MFDHQKGADWTGTYIAGVVCTCVCRYQCTRTRYELIFPSDHAHCLSFGASSFAEIDGLILTQRRYSNRSRQMARSFDGIFIRSEFHFVHDPSNLGPYPTIRSHVTPSTTIQPPTTALRSWGYPSR